MLKSSRTDLLTTLCTQVVSFVLCDIPLSTTSTLFSCSHSFPGPHPLLSDCLTFSFNMNDSVQETNQDLFPHLLACMICLLLSNFSLVPLFSSLSTTHGSTPGYFRMTANNIYLDVPITIAVIQVYHQNTTAQG